MNPGYSHLELVQGASDIAIAYHLKVQSGWLCWPGIRKMGTHHCYARMEWKKEEVGDQAHNGCIQ